MAFEGYKLKFDLHAAHSNVGNHKEKRHFHTFTITLFLRDTDEQMDLYNDIEKHVNSWLSSLQNQYLDETELFEGCETTLEAIGDRLFQEFKPRIEQLKFELIRLEVFENPIRTYSVSDKLLDNQANEINFIPSSLAENSDWELQTTSFGEGARVRQDKIENLKEEIALKEKESQSRDSKIQNNNPEHMVRVEQKNTSKRKAFQIEKLMLCKTFFALLIFGGISLAIMYTIKIGGLYPQGSDTLCHLYRADILLEHIKSGKWYPLYDPMWYNGVEIMRYWAPLPLYFLAFLQFLIGGTALDAYIVFCGAIFFIGAVGWLMLGCHFNRIGFSVFMAVTWYFLPENMRLLILDGNLPRVVINTALPFLLYFIWKFIDEQKKKSILGVILCTSFIGLCHIGIAFMVIVTVLLFVGCYTLINKKRGIFLKITTAMIIGICMIGVWVVPSLIGGGASRGEAGNQVMSLFFDNAWHALNPTLRYAGNLTNFYYGLSIFILCMLGIFLSNKKAKPGFITGLFIFLCTSKSAYSLFVLLPFSQFLWMIRFVTVSFAFVWLSFLLWKGLKKPILVSLCVLITIDCASSIPYIYVEAKDRVASPLQAQVEQADDLLLNDAKDITVQRMAFFDLSGYGSFAPYYVAGIGRKVPYVFGAGWEGAKTSDNIVRLNSAIENGRYTYVFDRSLELGTDTLLFPINQLQGGEMDINTLIQAGIKFGYSLVKQNETSILFHMDIDGTFGTITQYDNLAVGQAANDIALLFPDFEEGRSSSLDDYTVEELCQYKKVYLSDFEYKDKKETEKKLKKVADSGTSIYVDMNRIPKNKSTNNMELFGVTAQNVLFSESFPTLWYEGSKFETGPFVKELKQWSGVYLSGLKDVKGFANMNNQKLPFLGTAGNENITLIGFNLVYHSEIASDQIAEGLVGKIFDESSEKIPKRQIVPVDILYENSRIVLGTENSKVNAAISYLDIFTPDRPIAEQNNCVILDKGVTTIYLKYPYLLEGCIVSTIGFAAMIGFIIFILKNSGNKEEQQ